MTVKSGHKALLKFVVMALFIGMTALIPASASQAATSAGTVVNNQASVTFNSGGSTYLVVSNVSSLTVQELLELTVVSVDISNVSVASGATQKVLTFQLQNAGNGTDSYSISNSVVFVGSDFNPDSMDVYLDTNGNLTYGAGDTLYVPGTNDPVLAAGASLRLFVVSDIPIGLSEGDLSEIRLTVTSKAGTGPAGTLLAGQGDSGTNAIIGNSQGSSNDTSIYEVLSGLVMVKTATVVDPLGGSLPISGAEIRYTITVDVSGGGTLTGVQVTDAVPAYTTFVPGSFELNGTPLSNATGDDAGDFDNNLINGIAVQWVTLAPADGTQVIRFNVKID